MAVAERAHPDHPGFRPGTKAYKRLVNRYGNALAYVMDKRVLDVPCGVGWGTAILSEYAAEAHGLDLCAEAVEFGRSRYQLPGLVVGDMTAMPYESGFFDVVVCFEGYEHIGETQQQGLVEEIYRVLKPGGRLVMTVPLAGYSGGRNEFHLHEPTKEEVSLTLILFETQELRDIKGVLWFVGSKPEGDCDH